MECIVEDIQVNKTVNTFRDSLVNGAPLQEDILTIILIQMRKIEQISAIPMCSQLPPVVI